MWQGLKTTISPKIKCQWNNKEGYGLFKKASTYVAKPVVKKAMPFTQKMKIKFGNELITRQIPPGNKAARAKNMLEEWSY